MGSAAERQRACVGSSGAVLVAPVVNIAALTFLLGFAMLVLAAALVSRRGGLSAA